MKEGKNTYLVVDGNERVVGRERARAALAVHQQRAQAAVHHVLLNLNESTSKNGSA